MSKYAALTVGVLALQGDFERHVHQIKLLGATPREVRTPEGLIGIDALIIPGGESTTMSLLMDRFGLRDGLKELARTKPVWGTCAGMIMAGTRIDDNQAGVQPLGIIDIGVVRNGYGRQIFSFEETIEARLAGAQVPLTATFIRAPRVTALGAGVQVLAQYKDSPALVEAGRVMASSFHTELGEDTTLLGYFLEKCL